MSYILGISAFYHDSAAALVCDGEDLAAAQEERFSRKKHDARFLRKAIEYCLKRISLNDGDKSVFYEKPLVKLERLLGEVLLMMDFLADLWGLLRERKKFCSRPIFVVRLFMGMLLVFAQGSAVAPFIYTLF